MADTEFTQKDLDAVVKRVPGAKIPDKMVGSLITGAGMNIMNAWNPARLFGKLFTKAADDALTRPYDKIMSEHFSKLYNPIYHDTLANQFDIALGKKEGRNRVAGYGAEYDSPYELKCREKYIKYIKEIAMADYEHGIWDEGEPEWWKSVAQGVYGGESKQYSLLSSGAYRDIMTKKQAIAIQSLKNSLTVQLEKNFSNPSIKQYFANKRMTKPLNFEDFSHLAGMYCHAHWSSIIQANGTGAEFFEVLADFRTEIEGAKLYNHNKDVYFGFVDYYAPGKSKLDKQGIDDVYYTAMKGGVDKAGNVYSGNRFGCEDFADENRALVEEWVRGARANPAFDFHTAINSKYLGEVNVNAAKGTASSTASIVDKLTYNILTMNEGLASGDTYDKVCKGTSRRAFFQLSKVNGEIVDEMFDKEAAEIKARMLPGAEEARLLKELEDQRKKIKLDIMHTTQRVYSPEAQEGMYLESARGYMSKSMGVKVWVNIYGQPGPKKDPMEAAATALKQWMLEIAPDKTFGQETKYYATNYDWCKAHGVDDKSMLGVLKKVSETYHDVDLSNSVEYLIEQNRKGMALGGFTKIIREKSGEFIQGANAMARGVIPATPTKIAGHIKKGKHK
ncbi:MAG: hypothetical protein LBL34_00320 [Clostridiales bacterium]|jgi:hypothetical protein|nr:hypothetical protein [Clostridiales bacterium]